MRKSQREASREAGVVDLAVDQNQRVDLFAEHRQAAGHLERDQAAERVAHERVRSVGLYGANRVDVTLRDVLHASPRAFAWLQICAPPSRIPAVRSQSHDQRVQRQEGIDDEDRRPVVSSPQRHKRANALFGGLVDQGREGRRRRGYEDRRERKVDAQALVDELEDLGRGERRPADVEEVVIGAQRLEPEDALPDCPQTSFGGGVLRRLARFSKLPLPLRRARDSPADRIERARVASAWAL